MANNKIEPVKGVISPIWSMAAALAVALVLSAVLDIAFDLDRSLVLTGLFLTGLLSGYFTPFLFLRTRSLIVTGLVPAILSAVTVSVIGLLEGQPRVVLPLSLMAACVVSLTAWLTQVYFSRL